jgi:cytochrome b561
MDSQQTNSEFRYTATAKALHWIVVMLLIAQFALALTMPHMGRNTKPETLINLHFSVGALILAVVVIRLAWRWTHREPAPVDGLPPWQMTSSRILHYALYVVLVVIPVLGWMNASFRGFEVWFFGMFKLPPLLATRQPGFGWTGDVHTLVSYYVLLTLAGLHILMSLYHWLVRKDHVMARMLPARWT